MANTRHTYHLHSKEIEEIIRNNGLPEEISTETQLWDLIIKKATYSSPKLLFPLIYEIYGKKISRRFLCCSTFHRVFCRTLGYKRNFDH